MRSSVFLLLTCLFVPTSSMSLEPSIDELLDSIALSEENIQRFYPKVVENMNEINIDRFPKIRAYVAGILPFEDICKGTYKPNLCANKLKKPIEGLMKSFTSLLDNETRNETNEALEAHCALKTQLKKLANAKVISLPPFLMPEYPKPNGTILARLRVIDELFTTEESPKTDLENTLEQLRNTIELMNNMLNGMNNTSELNDILKKLNVFEAALNVSG